MRRRGVDGTDSSSSRVTITYFSFLKSWPFIVLKWYGLAAYRVSISASFF